MCIAAPDGWDASTLSIALRALVEQHDALRLVFDGQRAWHGPMPSSVPVDVLDLSTLAPDARDAAQADAATRLQGLMRLDEAPLLRALRVDRGEESARLILAMHHLVVDGVSWRILLDDLQRAGDALARGAPVALGPKSASWQRWVEAQRAWALDGDRAEDVQRWRDLIEAPVAGLPIDRTPGASSGGWTTVALCTERTEALLRRAGRAYRTEINELLLTALALTLRDWTGGPAVGVCLEGHGREQSLLGDLDVSRTVGWFTTLFPVRLDPGPAEGTDGIAHAIHAIKAQLRAVPHKGMIYGMLRWLGEAEGLTLPSAYGVTFNYLGQVQRGAAGPGADAGPVGRSVGSGNRLPSPVAFDGVVVGGRLQIRVDWDRGCFADGVIEGLATAFLDALEVVIAHCVDAAGHSPATAREISSEGLALAALQWGDRGPPCASGAARRARGPRRGAGQPPHRARRGRGRLALGRAAAGGRLSGHAEQRDAAGLAGPATGARGVGAGDAGLDGPARGPRGDAGRRPSDPRARAGWASPSALAVSRGGRGDHRPACPRAGETDSTGSASRGGELMAWDDGILEVVVNHEEQYSIWPAHREPPAGWRKAGKQGTKAECLAYIDEVWTDMRPLSLREKMRAQGLD